MIDGDRDNVPSPLELAKFYEDIQLELRAYLKEKGYFDGDRGVLLSDKTELLMINDQLGRN